MLSGLYNLPESIKTSTLHLGYVLNCFQAGQPRGRFSCGTALKRYGQDHATHIEHRHHNLINIQYTMPFSRVWSYVRIALFCSCEFEIEPVFVGFKIYVCGFLSCPWKAIQDGVPKSHSLAFVQSNKSLTERDKKHLAQIIRFYRDGMQLNGTLRV